MLAQNKCSHLNQNVKIIDEFDKIEGVFIGINNAGEAIIQKNEKTIIRQSGLLINFFGGFIGSVIGTLTILFLYMNEYLPLDLLKLK